MDIFLSGFLLLLQISVFPFWVLCINYHFQYLSVGFFFFFILVSRKRWVVLSFLNLLLPGFFLLVLQISVFPFWVLCINHHFQYILHFVFFPLLSFFLSFYQLDSFIFLLISCKRWVVLSFLDLWLSGFLLFLQTSGSHFWVLCINCHFQYPLLLCILFSTFCPFSLFFTLHELILVVSCNYMYFSFHCMHMLIESLIFFYGSSLHWLINLVFFAATPTYWSWMLYQMPWSNTSSPTWGMRKMLLAVLASRSNGKNPCHSFEGSTSRGALSRTRELIQMPLLGGWFHQLFVWRSS